MNRLKKTLKDELKDIAIYTYYYALFISPIIISIIIIIMEPRTKNLMIPIIIILTIGYILAYQQKGKLKVN